MRRRIDQRRAKPRRMRRRKQLVELRLHNPGSSRRAFVLAVAGGAVSEARERYNVLDS